MSTYSIWQNKAYTVMLADSLGHRSHTDGSQAPLLAPKLVRVAPGIYAAHAGYWQPALTMLHALHDYISSGGGFKCEFVPFAEVSTERRFRYAKVKPTDLPMPSLTPTSSSESCFDDLARLLTRIGADVYGHYKRIWGMSSLEVKVPLVLSGKYRHPEDIGSGMANTLVIWETESGLVPRRATHGIFFAVTADLTSLVMSIINDQTMRHLLTTGPLSAAMALDGVHALVAKLTTYVSPDSNIIMVGEGDEYSVLKGNLIHLPTHALNWG